MYAYPSHAEAQYFTDNAPILQDVHVEVASAVRRLGTVGARFALGLPYYRDHSIEVDVSLTDVLIGRDPDNPQFLSDDEREQLAITATLHATLLHSTYTASRAMRLMCPTDNQEQFLADNALPATHAVVFQAMGRDGLTDTDTLIWSSEVHGGNTRSSLSVVRADNDGIETTTQIADLNLRPILAYKSVEAYDNEFINSLTIIPNKSARDQIYFFSRGKDPANDAIIDVIEQWYAQVPGIHELIAEAKARHESSKLAQEMEQEIGISDKPSFTDLNDLRSMLSRVA